MIFSDETFDNFVLRAPGATGTTVPSETVPLVEIHWQSVFATWYQVQVAAANSRGQLV
jgi:hypothetical protein